MASKLVMMLARRIAPALLLAAATVGVVADDREDYNRRAAQADAEAFRSLDRDADGRLTVDEARPDLSFGPRFDDADVNRDGVLTGEEMSRYLASRYGRAGEAAASRFDEQSNRSSAASR